MLPSRATCLKIDGGAMRLKGVVSANFERAGQSQRPGPNGGCPTNPFARIALSRRESFTVYPPHSQLLDLDKIALPPVIFSPFQSARPRAEQC